MSQTTPETSSTADALSARLAEVRRRIVECAQGAGRAPDDVRLLAVSKTHPAEIIDEAIGAGARDFGENRVQEAIEKRISIKNASGVRWHLIGHLQANKARRAVQMFDYIHSLDSVALAARLDRLCGEEKRARLPVLIQIDLGGEATKSGAAETEIHAIAHAVRQSERLSLAGLMTLPPFLEDAELVRPFFRRLREMRDEMRAQDAFAGKDENGIGGGELSMGMSHDYRVAIEEGATIVRVGTAIFGARKAASR